MDFDETYAEMNITLGDSDDVTFTPEEKRRALTKAWRDPYVVKTVWDTTLTYSDTSYQYPVPSGMTTVKDVGISASNSSSDFPGGVDGSIWSVVDGKLQFKPSATSIPTGWTLYLKGNKKLNKDTDTIDNETLQEYVIALGAYNTLTLLSYKKANLFLKNDMTMGELLALKQDLRRDIIDMRSKLQREFEKV